MSYSSVLSKSRYGSELSVLLLPRTVNPARRAVLYSHGANGDGAQAVEAATQRGVTRNMAALAEAGLVVLGADMGGPQTFGNDTLLTAMEGHRDWLWSSGLCATDKLILAGASMGNLSSSRFAAAHPTQVAGIVAWIPGIDIEDMRTRDVLGTRSLINTAWGLPAGSYIGGADQTPVPARGKPLDPSNLALVNAIPTHLFYSSADTVTTSAAVDAYAAGRSNVTKHLASTTLDHSDAAVIAADVNTAVGFCQSIA